MRKMREFLLGAKGQANYCHVVSRTAGRGILFGDDEKGVFRILMLQQLKFSGFSLTPRPRDGESFSFVVGGV